MIYANTKKLGGVLDKVVTFFLEKNTKFEELKRFL